jgi:hypothetical protein
MSDSPKIENKLSHSMRAEDGIPEVTDPVACAEFQAHLPELMDGNSPNIAGHPHVKSCANCAALVRDLESIAEAARELLPVYDPSPDLWSQIQTAMLEEKPAGDDGSNAAGKKPRQ